MSTPEIHIGAMLKRAREARGFTQSQLAQKLNITRDAVAKCEAEPLGITIDRMLRICEALDFIVDINLTSNKAP